MSAGENIQPASPGTPAVTQPAGPDAAAIEALAELEAGLLTKLRAAARQQQDFQKALEARDQAMLGREQEISLIKSQLAELAQTLAQEKEQSNKEREQIAASRAALEQERLAANAERAAADATLAQRVRELEDELKQSVNAARQSLAQVSAERDALASRLNDATATAAADAAERERLAEALTAARTQAIEAASAHAIAADAHRTAEDAIALEHSAALEDERARFASLLSVVEEYEAWIACERAEWVTLTKRLHDANTDAQQAGEVVDALKVKLKEAIAAQARKKPTQPGASERSVSWVEHRRARLAKVREAMAERISRLQKGESALSKRFEVCEQILSQRAALAATHQKLRVVEQRHLAQRATTRAGAVGLCGSFMLAILAGLSWAAAHEFAPATFEAESVLVADSRGKELGTGELAEWQRFHESLLLDPLFHEAAADRFKRQGAEKLVTPGQVSQMISQSVTTESLKDGELRIRMKGQGADQTERVLDTLTASLASHANAASSRRIDGGLTKIGSPAHAGDAPIDQTRNVWALAIFGGATVVAFTLVGLVYLRLSRAKTLFEQDTTIAATLDEARWVDPRSIAN